MVGGGGGEGEGEGPRLPLTRHTAQLQYFLSADRVVRGWKGDLGLPLFGRLQSRFGRTHQGVLRGARRGSESEREGGGSWRGFGVRAANLQTADRGIAITPLLVMSLETVLNL